MAWKREKKTSDGRLYYEIRCHPTRGGPEHCERWYFPDGWSRAHIERASDKALTDFEQRVRSGEHQTQKEIVRQAAIEAENEEKKETVGNYVETVYFKTVELSENARASYEAQLRLHILPYIGDKKVSEVKPEDIEAVWN